MFLLELLVGLLTGFISGLFGVGGGFVLVPLLTLLGVSIKTSIGLSLIFICVIAISGVVRHYRQRTLDFGLALALSLGAVLTAQLGAQLVIGLDPHLLKLLFGLLTVAVAVLYLFRSGAPTEPPPDSRQTTGAKDEPPDIDRETSGKFKTEPQRWSWLRPRRERVVGGKTYRYRVNLAGGLLIGLGVGFISGLFGVGGGFLLMPLMVSVLRVPLKIAVGTSLLSVIAPAISGSLALWQAGQLELDRLPPLLIGGLVGAQIGSWLVLRLDDKFLRLGFLILLGLISCYMLALGFGLF